MVHRSKVFSSAVNQNAKTPRQLMRYIRARFGTLTDVAPVNHRRNSLAETYRWPKRCYVNPPFNNIAKWLTKAVHERREHGSASLFLIPFRPHRKYMQHHADAFTFVEILTDITFQSYAQPIPHRMALVSIGIPQGRRGSRIRRVPRFYLLCNTNKETFISLPKRLKQDFALRDGPKMLRSVKEIPARSHFFIPFAHGNVAKVKALSIQQTVVVPSILHTNDRKGKLFLGSYGVLRTKRGPSKNKQMYKRLPVFFNDAFVQTAR